MNITFVCNEYPPRPQGGIGTFVYFLSHELVRLGHYVTVVGLSDRNTEWDDAGVRVVTRACPDGVSELNKRKVLRDWLEEDAVRNGTDIIEVPEFDGMLPFRFEACPVVVRLHLSASTIAIHRLRLPDPWIYFCERQTLSMHRNWIGVSQYVLSLTQKTFRIQPRRSRRIYNFAPPVRAVNPQDVAAIRSSYGKYVLFAGKMSIRKGALILARAAKTFLRDHSDLQLVYLGADTRKWCVQVSTWARLYAGPEAAERIHFIGTRPHSEVMSWMSAAIALISPSKLEACPMVIVEAFQCEVPVVYSKCPPGPELIENGRTGILVNPKKPSEIAAAVDNLLGRPEWASSLATEAKRSADQRFTISRCVQETLEFYTQLVEENRTKSELDARVVDVNPMSTSMPTVGLSPNFIHRILCPACGASKSKVVLSMPYSDARIDRYMSLHYQSHWEPERLRFETYKLLLCHACGLIYQETVPSSLLLQDIYDKWIPPASRVDLRNKHTLDHYAYLASETHFMLAHLGKKPMEVKVLDFGMGWAEWAEMARAYGCDVFGAELSRERIAYAEAIGIPVVSWEEIPGGNYDFINTEQVFEHLVDPLGTLKHLRAGLRPGGLIKISVPDGRHAPALIAKMPRANEFKSGALMVIHPLEHINCFRHRSLDALACAADLEAVTPRLMQMYAGSSGWSSPAKALRNIVRPIYRHIFPKSTYKYYTARR